MAKNKRQWGRFKVENRKIHSFTFYDVKVDVSEHTNKNDWKTLETYDYFRNARAVARKLDNSLK